jgi:hypothetical protein
LKFPNPDDIIDGLKNAVDCDSCHSLLVPLKTLAELGDSAFVQTLTATCKVFKVGYSSLHSKRPYSKFKSWKMKMFASVV